MTARQETEPEFTDTDDRPAWWHRKQWRTVHWGGPAYPVGQSAPTTDGRFPPLPASRVREIEEDLAAGRSPWHCRHTRVKAVPRPARSARRRWRKTPERIDLDGAARTYLVEADGLGLVKIGIAKDPEARVRFLQTGQPMDLFLRWSVLGSYESALHERFRDYRVRGEWFDLRPLGNPVDVVTEAINEIRLAEITS